MAKVQWNDNLSVGVELIDEQHKTWIRHLNDVASAMESGFGAGRVAETLGFLVDYTKQHFAMEERAMEKIDYPAISEHRGRHAELVRTLDDLVQDFEEEGATHVLAEAVDTLLGNWFVEHISEVDHQLAAYLKEHRLTIE